MGYSSRLLPQLAGFAPMSLFTAAAAYLGLRLAAFR